MGMILRIERTSTRKKDVEGLSCGFEGICFGSRHINATSMKTLHGMERKKQLACVFSKTLTMVP